LLAKDLSVLDTPEFAKIIGSRLNDLMAQGKIIFESAHRRKDGSVMPVEVHARTISLSDRQLILSVARDITRRQIAENEIKFNEARLASLVKIGQYESESESIQDLLDFALDEAIALTGSKIGYIYFYDDETRQFTLNTWSKEVMQECTIAEPQTIYQLEKTGIWGEAVRQARPIMVNDFQAPHPLKKGYPEGHAQLDKFLTIPVFSGERIVAVVAVANKETDYDEADIRQLTLMMDTVWKIVARRQVEEELRQREQEYRSLVNNIPGFVFKGYADYTVDFFDDKIETFTGYSKEEFNSKRLKWSELVIQEDLQNAKAILVQALKLDRQYVREYRLKKKEGEIVWIQERSQIVKDPGGDIDSISGIFFDITERKRVEEALRESQEKLNAILETTPAGIFLVNGEGCITFANRMMADLFAYRNDEILGTAYVDLVHPDERSLGFMKMKSLMAGEIDFVSLERRYLAADGRGFWGHLSGRQLLDANGGFVGLVGVITDITARKLAEEELRLKGKLLDGASDSIFLHDQTGHILYVNEAAYKDRGYTKEELLALDISALVTPEFAGLRASLLQDLFTQGEIVFESAHLRKDGSALPVEIHARTIDLDHEKLILSAARDIGERKEAEEELRLAAQKWRTTFDAIGDAVCLIDRDLKIIQCNQAMVNLAGKPFAEIMGLTFGEILLGTSQPPEGCASSLMSKSGHRESMTLPRGDRWLHAVADPILNEAGEFTGGVYIIADITDFQRATQQIKDLNTLLRAIKEINEALLRVKSEKELFQQTCDLLLGVPYVRFTWIGLVDPDSLEVKPAAWAGAEDGYLSVVKVAWDDSPYAMGPTGEAFRTGRPFVRSNIETDPQPNPWREEALQRGFKSSLALPFIHQTEVIGILKVYSGKTDAFGSEETEFFNQVAGDISVGVKSLRLEQELVQGVIKLQIMIHQTVGTIATIVETRDPYTAGHQQGVAHLAGAIATQMSLDADCLQGLRVAGLLHDIGKIVVPAEILSKPGRLNEMEFLLIKAHSQVGADILGKINFPWPVAQIVLQHHERINGSGYPQGLTAPDILLEARILAVADVVEAMSSHRPYRAALGIDQALDEITENKGVLYDVEVVDVCVKLFTEKGFRFQT
jgi:PAS domain S-box-containing protein/putative nucleotidyltransferase with HDIG domain